MANENPDQARIDEIVRNSALSQQQKFEQIRQINLAASRNNAKIAQDSILSGRSTFNDLTQQQKIAFTDAAFTRGAPFAEGSKYNPASIQSIDASLKQMIKNQEDSQKIPGWMKTGLKPIEALGSGIYWLWSNTISRWTSFALLEVHAGFQSLDNLAGGKGDVLDFGENWKASKEFSPAQALIMAPMTADQLKDRGIDLRNPKMKGYASEEWFTKGWQKWTTGLTDAAYSFWADPFILAAKGVGGLRQAGYVKPGMLARSDADIAALSGRKDVNSLFDQIDGIKAKALIDGEYSQTLAIDRVRQFVPTAKRSAAADALATSLVMAETRAEQALVLRSAMGDTTAITKLSDLNEDAARAIRVADAKFASLESNYATAPVAVQNGPWGQQMKARLDGLTREIKTADAQRGFYSQSLAASRSVESLYYGRVTTPLGIRARTRIGEAVAAKAEYTWSTAPKVLFQNFNSRIVRVLRSPMDTTPQSWINMREADSFKSVKAAYRDLPRGFFGADDAAIRSAMVGEYTAATIAERPMVLKRHEARIVKKLAARHGVSEQNALDLYRWYDAKRGGMARAVSGQEAYSAARYEGNFTADVIDHSAAGGSITMSPVLGSQIATSHVMMNFSEMNMLLKRAGSQIERILRDDPSLLRALGGGPAGSVTRARLGDTIGGKIDTLGAYWKVAQLARLGYGPRAIGDEFAGQVAALGGIAMLARVGEGLKVSAQENMIRLTRGAWQHDKRIAVDLGRMFDTARMEEMLAESTRLEQQIQEIGAFTRDPTLQRAQRATGMAKLEELKAEKAWVDNVYAEAREAAENATAFLRGYGQEGSGRGGKVTRREKQGLKPVKVEGLEGSFAGGFSGRSGYMYRNDLSSQTTFAMQMGVDADRTVRRIRGNGWVTIQATDEKLHMQAWLRDLNRQIRNDALARRVLMGDDIPAMVSWLRTAEGRAYRDAHPMGKQMPAQELAERVATHVNHYIDPNVAGADIVRSALLTRDVTGKELKDLYPSARSRPDVNAEQLGYALGRGIPAQTVAGLLDGFYKYMNALPAEFLSRNPLFNQLYRSHINDIGKGMVANGRTHLTAQEFDAIELAAKRLALRDTKALTFNMDYESRLTHAVRFIYPFMGAQSESWARWGKIIADKPQVIGHAGNLYNMPMRMQVATDVNGNPVSPDGYATNTETGERYKVDKTEVLINVVIPKGLRSSFRKLTGMAATELQVPLNSFNLVAPDKTWFIPSAGPVVQIPANKLVTSGFLGIPAQFDKADLFKDLGVLPYGPRDSWVDFVNPATGRRLGDSQNEYSDNFQKAMFEIAQEESWKYANGNRAYQPDWDEIRNRARQYTTFKTFINFISPVTVDTANPYDFYREAYKKMVKEDPENGEIAFRDKYGDSMWMFSQTLSKNNGGLPATDAAVRADAAFMELRDSLQDPALMRLIAGPYAEGSFSPGAYYYQLNTPVQSGSDVMQRDKLTARQAFEKSKQDEGWYQYNKVMLSLQQQLFARGLNSYEEAGAEDLLNKKRLLPTIMGMEKLDDGRDNPFYNPMWKKDFDTVDRGAYERRVKDMWKIVNNPVMQAMANEGSRTDIIVLRQYLLTREAVNKELAKRAAAGGAATITAKANADLRDAFNRATNSFIEKDTRFGELHNRYLSRDMGYDKDYRDEED